MRRPDNSRPPLKVVIARTPGQCPRCGHMFDVDYDEVVIVKKASRYVRYHVSCRPLNTKKRKRRRNKNRNSATARGDTVQPDRESENSGGKLPPSLPQTAALGAMEWG